MTKQSSLFMAGFVALAALFIASSSVAGFFAAHFVVHSSKVGSVSAKTIAAIPVTVAPMSVRNPVVVVTTEFTTFAPKVERVATPQPAIAPSATIQATVEIPVTFAPTVASEQLFTFARAIPSATPAPTITPIPFPTHEPQVPKAEPIVIVEIESPKAEPTIDVLDSPIATPASEQSVKPFTPKQP